MLAALPREGREAGQFTCVLLTAAGEAEPVSATERSARGGGNETNAFFDGELSSGELGTLECGELEPD